jgi:hypothetical protein
MPSSFFSSSSIGIIVSNSGTTGATVAATSRRIVSLAWSSVGPVSAPTRRRAFCCNHPGEDDRILSAAELFFASGAALSSAGSLLSRPHSAALSSPSSWARRRRRRCRRWRHLQQGPMRILPLSALSLSLFAERSRGSAKRDAGGRGQS